MPFPKPCATNPRRHGHSPRVADFCQAFFPAWRRVYSALQAGCPSAMQDIERENRRSSVKAAEASVPRLFLRGNSARSKKARHESGASLRYRPPAYCPSLARNTDAADETELKQIWRGVAHNPRPVMPARRMQTTPGLRGNKQDSTVKGPEPHGSGPSQFHAIWLQAFNSREISNALACSSKFAKPDWCRASSTVSSQFQVA